MEADPTVPLLTSSRDATLQEIPQEEDSNHTETEGVEKRQEFNSSSYFSMDLTWEERKRIAISEITSDQTRTEFDVDYIHWLAYHRKSELIQGVITNELLSYTLRMELENRDEQSSSNEHQMDYSILKKNHLGLSPIIYSIWGEIDELIKSKVKKRHDSMYKTMSFTDSPIESDCTAILYNYLNTFLYNRAKKRESILYKSFEVHPPNVEISRSELFECEIGHMFKHRNVPGFTLEDLLYSDNFVSLSYLIEIKDETLIKALCIQNTSDSPLFISIDKKYTGCTEVLLKYILELLSNSNRSIYVKMKIEQEIEHILASSSNLIPILIEPMMLAAKKIQFRSDLDDLPIIIFRDSIENLEETRELEFKDDSNSEQILNTQIFHSTIKLPTISGSTSSLNLINSLSSCENFLVFRVPLIKYYIKKKWESLWFHIFFQTLLVWINIPLLIIILSEIKDQTMAIILFVSLNIILLLVELIQLISLGLFSYLGELNKLAAFYLIKIYMLLVLYVFYDDSVPILLFCCGVLFAIYWQIDKENRLHASNIELMVLFVGISVWTGWGWWFYLICAVGFGIATSALSLLEINKRAVQIFAAIYCGIAFVSTFVWCKLDYYYIMVPMGVVIGAIFFWLSLARNVKKMPALGSLISSIRLSIAMLFCLFYYHNRRISSIFALINFGILVANSITLHHDKRFESYMRVFLDIGNLIVSLMTLLVYRFIMNHRFIRAGFVIIPLITQLYENRIIIKSSTGYDRNVMFLQKLIPVSVLFLSNFQTSFGLLTSLLSITILNLCIEVTLTDKFVSNITKNVFRLAFNWNTIDIGRISLCGMWLYYYYTHELVPILVIYMLFSFTLLRGLTGFRCFSSTRYYVRLVLDSVSDIKAFIFLFFYSTLAFGILNSLNYRDEISFDKIWIKSYNLNLGAFDDKDIIDVTYVIFLIASIINVIIMLNLLISILGDSFDRFQVSASEIDYMEMVDVIREIETVMVWNRKRSCQKYLVVIDLIRDNTTADTTWEGKISRIEKNIKYELSPFKTEMKELKEMIQKLIDKQTPQNSIEIKDN